MEKAEGDYVIRWCDNEDTRAGYSKVEILVFHTFQELSLATLLTFFKFLNSYNYSQSIKMRRE